MSETWPEIKKRKMKERRGETFDWIQSLVMALLICVLVFTFGIRVISVSGSSMLDTLHTNDRILISHLFYKPRQGDVVVARVESFNSEPIVKRVIGVGGETVSFVRDDEGVLRVSVDGSILDEPYIREAMQEYGSGVEGSSIRVPEGCYFLMGDNRNNSSDSRYSKIGVVDERYIVGRALSVIVPGEDLNQGRSRDWGRFGAIGND